MRRWYDDALDSEHVQRLRASVAEGSRVMVLLGAGMSFGAARVGGRARFDNERWGPAPEVPEPPYPPTAEVAWDDDGLPLPSWPWLISRMRL